MRTRQAHRRPAEPNRLWRCVLSALVAICLVLTMVQPGTASDLAISDYHTAVHTAAGVTHGPTDTADQGLAQHCAHCGCHQPADITISDGNDLPATATVCIALAEVDGAVQTLPPPSEPPRG